MRKFEQSSIDVIAHVVDLWWYWVGASTEVDVMWKIDDLTGEMLGQHQPIGQPAPEGFLFSSKKISKINMENVREDFLKIHKSF